ncbi:hypothetical protein N2W52_001988 [Clostridium perfringens]|nr:hypothetical protein [Clostridium perfringens]MDK0983005.1 hypothetical protein [Clostridium perfringens]
MENKVVYCFICGKEISNEEKQCECGSKSFVSGEREDFTLTNIENQGLTVKCKCGSLEFNEEFNDTFIDTSKRTFKCDKCETRVEINSCTELTD